MKLIGQVMAAVALSATLVTAAQAHPSAWASWADRCFRSHRARRAVLPLPVYPHAANAGPAQLPIDAPPQLYAEPAIANIATIAGHGNASNVASDALMR